MMMRNGRGANMNPLLQKYLTDKYGENFEQDAQTQYDDRSSTLNTANLFSNLGDVVAGNKVGSANDYFNKLKAEAKDSTLGKIENDKKSFMTDTTFDNQQKESQIKLDANDPNSRQSKIVQDAVSKVYKGKFTPEQIARLSAADTDLIYRPLELEARLADQAIDRQYKRDSINLARQDKVDAKTEKQAEKMQTLAVPGYERTGEVLQKPEEAAKFRAATGAAEDLSMKLQKMRGLVDIYGSFEYGGKGGAEMKSLAREIQLLSKNEDMYKLGVLTGPDMAILEDIIADPTSLDSMFTRDGTRKEQIDAQSDSLIQKLNSSAKSLGYKKTGQAEAPPRTPVNPAEDAEFQAWKKSKGF